MDLTEQGLLFFKSLPQITGGKLVQLWADSPISELVIDSRKANPSRHSVFFAISGKHHDGHQFLAELYRKGCRQFVVEKDVDLTSFPDCNVLRVKSSLAVLQCIAQVHRSKFAYPVIGITGSNGKTIIKEWLYQLLAPDFAIVKNPGSYNSQLGVPLSVWAMAPHHTLGIFEAGISKPNEMEALEKIIRPTIGIFTNLLAAHDEGFTSRKQKAEEKAKLFSHCQTVIYCRDHLVVHEALSANPTNNQKHFSWGFSKNSDLVVTILDDGFELKSDRVNIRLKKTFADEASRENLFHCIAVMAHLGYDADAIQARNAMLKTLSMRLEMKEGLNGSMIIDDSYSNDLAGLKIALDFLQSQNSGRKIVFLSDLAESGLKPTDWINQVSSLLVQHRIDLLVAIGSGFSAHQNLLTVPFQTFLTTEDCLNKLSSMQMANATVLVKGARVFRLERIAQKLHKKIHGTVMEIDLGAVVHNLNAFRARLNPQTKIMAMVKAFAYGSGSFEVASILQYHKVDCLGVAYADEGKLLRSHGIHVPIMVMNPTEENFQTLTEFNLEPSIYSKSILLALIRSLNGTEIAIHLKLDTGMHRLGVEPDEIDDVIALLKQNPSIKVKSIYSHLAGSDESQHDSFSNEQANYFTEMADAIGKALQINPLRHILNSSGITRLSQYQFDMVRLGIGLYGVDPGLSLNHLKPAVTLRTTISQIKNIQPGETVGYGRHGKATQPMQLATLSIGYADGYSRAFSKGVGKFWVNGKLAPVVGNVCMDMTMIDITNCKAQEGDTVIVFGEELSVSEVASWINTIPYELLTNTSDRVKRVFFAESI